jgi:hypothetical protein
VQHGDFVFCIKFLKHKEALEAISIKISSSGYHKRHFLQMRHGLVAHNLRRLAGIASHGSPSEALNHPRGEISLFFTNVVEKPTTPEARKRQSLRVKARE